MTRQGADSPSCRVANADYKLASRDSGDVSGELAFPEYYVYVVGQTEILETLHKPLILLYNMHLH